MGSRTGWRKLLASLGLISALAAGRLSAQTPPMTNHARLWQAYRGRFLSQDGRVLDPQRNNLTTSEGQSYALFFSLVNNDRAHFDAALDWTQANLAMGDLGTHLPSWSWGQTKEGTWGILDPNSASDSDIWIAYDLIEAGRLWKEPRFTLLGKKLASLAAHKETAAVPGLGTVLMPGPFGFHFPSAWVLNPSYTPVFLLDRLAAVDPAGPWMRVAATIPMQLEQGTRGGFAMDWISYSPGSGFVPSLSNNQRGPGVVGSYDAIRVYLWTGMLSDSHPGKARMLKAISGMNGYLSQHGAPPEKINDNGVPESNDGPVGFSAAVLPYLKSNTNEEAFAQQMVRLKSQLDEKSYLYGAGYGTGPTYYDQNLVLFGSGWIENRFRFGNSGELLVAWTHP
jgi:endo-1,4-beta-D-glucanase Y